MSTTASRYQIRVRGRLDPSWSDRMWGMTIETATTEDGDGSITTTLTGALPDQSALSGIVSALVDMHFPVLSVQSLPHSGPAETVSSTDQKRTH